MELQKQSYHQLAGLARELAQVRQKRRVAKDTVSRTEPVVAWLEANRPVVKSLERLLGDLRKAEKRLENRVYIPQEQNGRRQDPMTMTNAEIVADYRQAKNKRAQIKILADLNATGMSVIKEILRDAGEVLPRAPLDGAQIEALYKHGLSDEKIAKEMGCSPGSIANWRKRNGGLPPNGSRAAEPSASGGLPDVCRQIYAILTALPAGSSEATRAAACELCRCLLWDEMVRNGIGLTSNESARADSP